MDFPPRNPNFIGTAFIFGQHFSITADTVNDNLWYCATITCYVISRYELDILSVYDNNKNIVYDQTRDSI